MKAVVCKEFGPPEKLVIEEVDDPTPSAGEVLLEVRSAALTYPDVLVIDNKYQYKVTPPFIPGGEVAGVVRSIGARLAGEIARRHGHQRWRTRQRTPVAALPGEHTNRHQAAVWKGHRAGPECLLPRGRRLEFREV